MTAQPTHPDPAIERLRELERQRVLVSRRRIERAQHARRVTALATRRTDGKAAPVLPIIAMESLSVIAIRRARLLGDLDGATIYEMAVTIRAFLPDDPDAAAHRAALREVSRQPSGEAWMHEMAPWRTPAEDRWTDAELRAASSKARKGIRTPEVLEARRAYDRIRRRRQRGERPDRGES